MNARSILVALILLGLMAGVAAAADLPTTPSSQLRYAQVLFTAGEYAKADPEARAVIAAATDTSTLCGACDVVILCRMAQGDFDGALQAAGALKSQIADAGAIAYLDQQIADIQAKQAAYNKALADLEAAITAHPSDEQGAAAAYQVGVTQQFWGKRAEALAAYQRVVDDFATSERALSAAEAASRLYLADRQYDALASAMSAVVSKHPGADLAAKAQYLIGRAYEAKGDMTNAEEAYHEVMVTYPESAQAKQAVAALAALSLAHEQPEDAIARLGAVAEEQAGTDTAVQAKYQMALIHLSQGQLDEADALLTPLHLHHPDSSQITDAWKYLSVAFFHRGADTNYESGRYDLAVADLTRALLDDSWKNEWWKGLFVLGRSQAELGHLDEAVAAHQRLVALVPDNPQAVWSQLQIADWRREQGRFADAANEYRVLLQRWPESTLVVHAKDRLAYCERRLSNP